LSTVERLTGQHNNEVWPPTLAFEGFEAGVKQVVGALMRDSSLVDEGRVQQAKIGELRRAAELELKAAQTRAQADAELRDKREQLDREAARATEQARQEAQQLEREVVEAKREVDAKVERVERVITKVEDQREKQIAAAERRARLETLTDESAALQKTRKAVASAERVDALASAVETKKSQRKNS
jgi:hypothetical protein